MDLKQLVRPNIWQLKPYSSARHEFEGTASVYLDANENPYESGYNRYPDPLQHQVKQIIADLKGVEPGQIFLGNGSDEAIDLLIRIFCIPAQDEILITPPTYGMYQVCADISDVRVLESLLTSDFQLNVDAILSKLTSDTKIIFLCSPNNPTGNLLSIADVERLLKAFQGIVVLDEAYADFSALPSWSQRLREFPQLVVLQTFSKAWGLAGIRLGMAFASPDIIRLMNAVKPPYNVNQLTQQKAMQALLEGQKDMEQQVRVILSERTRLVRALEQHPLVLQIYPSDANFLLVKFKQHEQVFQTLRSHGIVVRDRSKAPLCAECLRLTIGTIPENDLLLQTLNDIS